MKSAILLRRGVQTARIVILVFIAATAWVGRASAQTPSGPADDRLCFNPSQWMGRYPAEKGANVSRFIDLPCVHKSLRTLLPTPELRELLQSTTVDSPISVSGDYLFFTRCQPHNCAAENAMVIINTKRGDFIVGFYTRSANRSTTRWYSDGQDPLELPHEIRENFLRGHIPAP
jgi:hypothetical protein